MKKALVFLAISLNVSFAQIPVTDGANLALNQINTQDSLVNTAKSVARTLKQIEEYETQLRQYQTQLTNLVNVPSRLLNDVNQMFGEYQAQANYIAGRINSLGGLDRVIELFKDSYRDNPCLSFSQSPSACTPIHKAELMENDYTLSTLQREANKDIMKFSSKEEIELSNDSGKVNEMNDRALSIEGNKDGLQTLAELLSSLNKQMISIRTSDGKNAKAETIERMKKEDRDAQTKAYNEMMLDTTYAPDYSEVLRKYR